ARDQASDKLVSAGTRQFRKKLSKAEALQSSDCLQDNHNASSGYSDVVVTIITAAELKYHAPLQHL
ncbi:MAG: hypothetical protein ACI4SY_02045, partial [Sutterella sp.]